ncbi:MAG: amidohydrolase [Candidatus Caldatribacteriota bacterium]|nr:amidohydrolase [Candidatus Caldatribacteriota bacterium]
MGLIIKNARIYEKRKLSTTKSILIEENKIVKIGHNFSDENKHKILDISGRIILPGLIDCHTHLYQTFGRGLMDDLHITKWLEIIWQFPHLFSEEALYYSTLLGAMEAIKSGTTAVGELLGESAEKPIIQGLMDSGIRAVVGKMENDYPEGENTPVKSTQDCLNDSKQFFNRWHGKYNSRLKVKLSFAGLPACTDTLIKNLVKLSKEYGIGIHAHAAESQQPTNQVRKRFNKGEISALYELGALGPFTQLAHVIWVDDEEIKLLAQTGTSVIHCPYTNCKVTDGISPMYKMQKAGVNITFGCDGGASSSNYDVLSEARLGSMLQKVFSMDEKTFNPLSVYDMLTVNGARALNLEKEIGRIKEGYKADMIVLEYPTSKMLSEDVFINNFIYSCSGNKIVRDVIIDGKFIVKNHKFIYIDEDTILNKARKIFLKEKGKLIAIKSKMRK